ncbi:vigilin [Nephila pilipes]|nr:vigilin [Nephila pilipes]
MTIEIDPKHHCYFVARGAEVLKPISNDYGDVTIGFPKIGSNSSKIALKRANDFLEPTEKRLHEIVEDLEAMVTVGYIIPQDHHPNAWGSKDSKLQNIQRQLNVTIKFSDREKPEDADKVMMNGDAHADYLEAEFQVIFEAQRDELGKHTK